MSIKADKSKTALSILSYTFITIASVFCIIPFWLIISGSFTDNNYVVQHGYNFFPGKFSLAAYKAILKTPENVINAYGVSIFVTITGTLLGLFFNTMAGYVLNRKDFKNRNRISFFIYFTTLFSGGLIPFYVLVVSYLKLQDSFLALILPGLLTPFYILLMRNFMKSIPDEIIESAKIDGAGDFKIFYKIVIQLSGPAIATIGLFQALGYWNDWFTGALFIDTQTKYPLQLYLYNIIQNMEFLRTAALAGAAVNIETPTDTAKMAMTVVATGPVIFLYPFLQKYFVKGLTVGAVKG